MKERFSTFCLAETMPAGNEVDVWSQVQEYKEPEPSLAEIKEHLEDMTRMQKRILRMLERITA